MAISTDVRTRDFMGALEDSYVRLSRRREDLRVLFLEANDDVLLKRYNFTRREHPLGENLMFDFARERELLAPLRSIADTLGSLVDVKREFHATAPVGVALG